MDNAQVELVAFGDEVPEPDRLARVGSILEGLEASLVRAGRSWRDVSLLLLANSILHKDPRRQEHLDKEHLRTAHQFGTQRGWVPPLIGATTMGGFFTSYGHARDEVRSGLIFVAFCSSALPELPVSWVTRDSDRENVPRQAVRQAAQAAARLRQKMGLPGEEDFVYEDSVALLFSTGSAHNDYSMKDDFRACYGAGVRLVDLADEARVKLVGGHASNNRPSDDPRREPQRQVLYYSAGDASARTYERTDHFGAVCAFVPTGAPGFELSHPYEPIDGSGPLNVAWSAGPDDIGSTRFLVESINEETVAQFLDRHWGLDHDRLLQMADDETPNPHKARTARDHIAVCALPGKDLSLLAQRADLDGAPQQG